ncbi:MAG: hypothetical protein ACE148_00995 [Vicinamibacterales bacterium]
MKTSVRRSWALAASASAALLLLVVPGPAHAQVEITGFLGRAFPVWDERLVLRAPSAPSLPGVEVTASGTPELRTDGGPVFGGAIALHFGPIGIEGRLDATDIGFDAVGARYDLVATEPPFQGLSGSVMVGDGRFDVERLNVVSLNLRLRTPGVIGIVASGGLSYLPDVTINGFVPVSVAIEGVNIGELAPRLRLVAVPGQSDHRWGVNGGAGLRLGGPLSLIAEVRVFYFRSYDLGFSVDEASPFVNELLENIDAIGFEPVIVNAQVGLSLRF